MTCVAIASHRHLPCLLKICSRPSYKLVLVPVPPPQRSCPDPALVRAVGTTYVRPPLVAFAGSFIPPPVRPSPSFRTRSFLSACGDEIVRARPLRPFLSFLQSSTVHYTTRVSLPLPSVRRNLLCPACAPPPSSSPDGSLVAHLQPTVRPEASRQPWPVR